MPATALFPLIVLFVIKVTGGMNLASILLILTGMQWYLLFNLLAGVSQVPSDLKEAARSFGLTPRRHLAQVIVPALLPSLITGSITAWGGGWNALILSEYFVYSGHDVPGARAGRAARRRHLRDRQRRDDPAEPALDDRGGDNV